MKETIINIAIGILALVLLEGLLCLLWWDNPIYLIQNSFWFRLWNIIGLYLIISMVSTKRKWQ